MLEEKFVNFDLVLFRFTIQKRLGTVAVEDTTVQEGIPNLMRKKKKAFT